MDKLLFQRNLRALSQKDPALCSRLSGTGLAGERYRFLDSRAGESVPALVDEEGAAHPLHSLVDPRKEGSRLVSALADEGFLIFLGLGGGFHIAAALERRDIHQVLAVDFDIHGIAGLFASKDYTAILGDPRFHLLVDLSAESLEEFLLETYQPALYGGIRLIPLRTRTALDQRRFNEAAEAVKSAIDRLSADYSVQAYFGQRWFANIIRNLFQAEQPAEPLPPIRRAAICAAGPSLDEQIPILAARRLEGGPPLFIIATDTSLPALLQGGIRPSAVVSIDCQHISCYHFIGFLEDLKGIPLFLDLASPPLLAALSGNPRFFSGGHPLTQYASRYWRPFPQVDTSGANVTYAALSVAESLGAENVELYGADFSYPLGKTYARGTYIYPYFEIRQNRLNPLEARHSAFLYRSSVLEKAAKPGGAWYYETATLRSYRESLEAKARISGARIEAAPGLGAPIVLPSRLRPEAEPRRFFPAGKPAVPARQFLAAYRRDAAALPLPEEAVGRYLAGLDPAARLILTTLLPAAAAVKRRGGCRLAGEVLSAVRDYALDELDRVLKRAEVLDK